MDYEMNNFVSQIRKNEFKRLKKENPVPPDKSKQYINLSSKMFVCKVCGENKPFEEGVEHYTKIRNKFKEFKMKHSSC